MPIPTTSASSIPVVLIARSDEPRVPWGLFIWKLVAAIGAACGWNAVWLGRGKAGRTCETRTPDDFEAALRAGAKIPGFESTRGPSLTAQFRAGPARLSAAVWSGQPESLLLTWSVSVEATALLEAKAREVAGLEHVVLLAIGAEVGRGDKLTVPLGWRTAVAGALAHRVGPLEPRMLSPHIALVSGHSGPPDSKERTDLGTFRQRRELANKLGLVFEFDTEPRTTIVQSARSSPATLAAIPSGGSLPSYLAGESGANLAQDLETTLPLSPAYGAVFVTPFAGTTSPEPLASLRAASAVAAPPPRDDVDETLFVRSPFVTETGAKTGFAEKLTPLAIPGLSLDEYAQFRAGLRVKGEDDEPTWKRFGILSRAAKDALQARFAGRFQQDPVAKEEFLALLGRHTRATVKLP